MASCYKTWSQPEPAANIPSPITTATAVTPAGALVIVVVHKRGRGAHMARETVVQTAVAIVLALARWVV